MAMMRKIRKNNHEERREMSRRSGKSQPVIWELGLS